MEPGPDKISEAFAGLLLPPACREEVLGDMRERRVSWAQYVLDATMIIPCVISSRIRRTTDSVVALTEAVSMYTAFVMAAWWLDRAILSAEGGFVRLAFPPAIFLLATILADAYSNPKKRWPLKPLFAPALGLALVYIARSALHSWALPPLVLAWGSGLSLLLLSTLRLIFPPLPDRPQAINGPVFWQKLELAPLSPALRNALLPCAILMAVIFYLLKK
jgi:hypothetical protein